jgi:hypothetical protein
VRGALVRGVALDQPLDHFAVAMLAWLLVGL